MHLRERFINKYIYVYMWIYKFKVFYTVGGAKVGVRSLGGGQEVKVEFGVLIGVRRDWKIEESGDCVGGRRAVKVEDWRAYRR